MKENDLNNKMSEDYMKSALRFYNIKDKIYEEKCIEAIGIIKENEILRNKVFEIHNILYNHIEDKIAELWNLYDISDLFETDSVPFVTNILLLLGFKNHKENIKKYKFSKNQICIHKQRVKERREYIMPQNKMQRMIFALLTVLVTVHAYVLYSLYVVNGNTLIEVTGAKSVIEAINVQGGVYMFGHMVPIWEVVIIEFVCAFVLEMLVGSQFSFKFASKVFNPKETHSVLFETAIICATVGIMCPAMSFLAAIMYYPYYAGFNIFTLLANFLKLVCFNFPFAFFTQLFFIQPFIRTVFKMLFRKNNNVEQIKKAIA